MLGWLVAPLPLLALNQLTGAGTDYGAIAAWWTLITLVAGLALMRSERALWRAGLAAATGAVIVVPLMLLAGLWPLELEAATTIRQARPIMHAAVDLVEGLLAAADDEDALAVAAHCLGMVTPEEARIAWTKNTMSLSRLRLSGPLWDELSGHPALRQVGRPELPRFHHGKLIRPSPTSRCEPGGCSINGAWTIFNDVVVPRTVGALRRKIGVTGSGRCPRGP